MIFTERTIKIANDVCNIDEPIVLYRGDYNVEARFTIINCPYKYTAKNSTNIIEAVDASYGQLVIKVPNDGSPIFSDVVETKEGSIVFTLSGEMIDESIEVGDYTFQIRLFDANRESRATIPPVENGISIREPIAFEDVTTTNEVGEATVGYAMTTAATPEDAFDSQGNYNKTTWKTGDRITDAKLNKIERGITGVNDKVPHYNETLMFEISGEDFGYLMNNNYFNINALNIDETNSYVGKIKMDINSNEEFIYKLVYDKTNNALIDENSQTYIYNYKSYDGTNFIEDTNSAVITLGITTFSIVGANGYFKLYEINKVKLDANCLPDNVSIPNSLTVGTRSGDIGEFSVAEGDSTMASGESSHAEGEGTEATGNVSHAEGAYTEAIGNVSHAEGSNTTARGDWSHAEGFSTIASGHSSHAEGRFTMASSENQHVQGKYNINDTENKYAHIVGNGNSNTRRSNAHTLDWQGNAWYQGKLSQDGTPTEDKDLVTKKYVDDAIENIQTSGGSNINDTTASATTTYSSNKIESIKENLSSQIEDIPKKTIIEDGKLYLAKSDGTKIDNGTTLPIGGTSTGDNPSSGTYDTEISLPYTANSDTDVELTFSAGSSVSYTNLCPDGSDISQYTIQNNGTSSTIAEIISDSEKGSCLHYKNGGTSGYSGLSLFSSNTWDSTHYYYVSYWVKMVTKSTNYPDYPQFNCGTSELGNVNTFNRDNLTSWQRISFITQPASYLKTNIGFNIQADGEFYFKPIIVLDMDGLGYDLSSIDAKAKTYIADLDTKVLQANNGFSCVVNNGSNAENIEVFSTGNKVYYYTVTSGNTLSINKRDGYNMPSVTAKVKGNSNITQDIEDVDIKITTRFAGKKVVFEGDSITDSDYHEAYNGKSWADYLANKLKMTIASNMALGGSSISTYNSAGSVVNRITTNDYPSDTKLFCIMAGTNDWNGNVALGDIDSTDTSTILGALNTIIDHLQTNYPDATIVIMTPMHRSGMRTATRTAGTLAEVAAAYEKVCMNWGVNCINTLKEFGMNAYNTTVANKFYVEQNSDWLHPNPAGHKRIAIRMAGYISTL